MSRSGKDQAAHARRGPAHRGKHRQAAGAFAQSLIAVLFGDRMTDAALSRVLGTGRTNEGRRAVYCSLILVPLRWSQQIRSFPTLFGEEEGGYLVSICRPRSDCDLRLKNGLFVRDFELQFSLIRGKLDDERRQKFRLPATAIGGLWFQQGVQRPGEDDGSRGFRPHRPASGLKVFYGGRQVAGFHRTNT